MLILSVESTCDETAVAVTENGRRVLTDQIFSQADLHAIYGGVVPEIASRSHVEVISQLAERAIRDAGVERRDLDAVAVSYAPGLIGAVLVGVNFAKSAAMALRHDALHIADPRLAREEKLAIVLGTEGDGLARDTIARCDYTVRIPMTHGVDSLNVAAASAVAFYQLSLMSR